MRNLVFGLLLVSSHFLILSSFEIRGEVHQAASCSQQSVNQAIKAAKVGDVVQVPPGTCTWKSTTTTEPAVIVAGKGITLVGTGVDSTVIIGEVTGHPRGTALLVENIPSDQLFRLTNVTFSGVGGDHGLIKIIDAAWIRIDNSRCDGPSGRCITLKGEVKGVIDHNEFINLHSQPMMIWGSDNGIPSWTTQAFSLGTADFLFIEDNEFIAAEDGLGSTAVDAVAGARLVFRYNNLTDINWTHHGTCSSGKDRSAHLYEVYENVFKFDRPWARGIFLRGGTGVIFNNQFEGTLTRVMDVANYRSCDGIIMDCQLWDRCDGDSPVDGNEDGTGYPCLDQIGRTTNQVSEPLYEWNNSRNGLDADITVADWATCTNPSLSDHIQEDRDYINDTPRPGYVPYSYPHPLTIGQVPPTPPTGLQLVNSGL